MREAICRHHSPSTAEEPWKPLAYVVHLADAIATTGGCGAGTDAMMYACDPKYVEYISLASDETLEGLVLAVESESTRTSSALTGETACSSASRWCFVDTIALVGRKRGHSDAL